MHRLGVWALLFLLGSTWRGRHLPGWGYLLCTYVILDLLCTLLQDFSDPQVGASSNNLMESVWRNAFLGAGLVYGGSLRMVMEGFDGSFTVTPWVSVITACVIAVGDVVLGSDVDALTPVVVATGLISMAYMADGSWGADMFAVISGYLVATPAFVIASDRPPEVFIDEFLTGYYRFHMWGLDDASVICIFLISVIITGCVTSVIPIAGRKQQQKQQGANAAASEKTKKEEALFVSGLPRYDAREATKDERPISSPPPIYSRVSTLPIFDSEDSHATVHRSALIQQSLEADDLSDSLEAAKEMSHSTTSFHHAPKPSKHAGQDGTASQGDQNGPGGPHLGDGNVQGFLPMGDESHLSILFQTSRQ
jgi:ABC-type multidrug transport system fused ATPase/permease subunit